MCWSYVKNYYPTINISGMEKCCTSGKYILWPWLTLGLLNLGYFVQLFTQSHDVRSFLLYLSGKSFGIATLSNAPRYPNIPFVDGKLSATSLKAHWRLHREYTYLLRVTTVPNLVLLNKWLSSFRVLSLISGTLIAKSCLWEEVTNSMCPTSTFINQREMCCTEMFHLLRECNGFGGRIFLVLFT